MHHNKVFQYENYKFEDINRISFLNKAHYKEVNEKIKQKKPILFLPTYLFETHLQDSKYSKSVYKIILIGILADGRKVTVILNGIRPYFEVRVPKEDNDGLVKDVDGKKCTSNEFIQNLVSKINKEELTKPEQISTIKAKPFKYYQEDLSKFVRFYYNKTSHKTKSNRAEAIKCIGKKYGYETATDDLSCYYRVVGRDYLVSFSTWMEISDYEEDLFTEAFKDKTFLVDITNYKQYKEVLTENLFKDKTVSLCWDIETWSPEANSIPSYKKPNDRIFCIGMTFQFINEKKPFLQICLCDLPSNSRPDHLTIICNTEDKLIECFSKVFSCIKPEYILGFNDSDYDWNWLINRASCTTGLLTKLATNISMVKYGNFPFPQLNDLDILKYNFKKERIKIEADCYVNSANLMLHGYIPVDVCTSFRKLYPTSEEYNLNYFLNKNNILGKDPMSYERMHENMKYYYELTELINYEDFKSVKHSPKYSPKKSITKHSPKKHSPKKSITKELTLEYLLNLEVQTEEVYGVRLINKMINEKLFTKEYTDKVLLISKICDNEKIYSKNINKSDKIKQKERIKSICIEVKNIYEEIITQNKQKEKSMDFNTLLNYKKKQFLHELSLINQYCVVDAKRCHDLMFIRSVILDTREISTLSYVSMFDGFYRANGMKVRNLTIAEGQKKPFNIRFSNIIQEEVEDAKYPGAYVFPPKKGLHVSKLSIEERIKKAKLTKNKNPVYQEWLDIADNELQHMYGIIKEHGPCIEDKVISEIEKNENKKLPKIFKDFLTEKIGRPIGGADFSSLYPSLMRAYNFSPDYCIVNKDHAKKLHEAGEKITKVEFDFNGRRRVGYFIWHNNEININNPDGTPNTKFKFGIYPYILNDLFNKRNLLKKKLKILEHKIEDVRKLPATIEEGGENYEEYENMIFERNYINCKQNALKVFMNTFYGVAGSSISPFFVIEVAGGVTAYGKKNIHLAYDFVTKQNCNVYYGDTDSIYLSVEEKAFLPIDILYYTNELTKINYWEKMVEISFEKIKILIKQINDMFEMDNGTKFLTMAFEEFLYPVCFTAKKKYFGIKHENSPNFAYIENLIKEIEFFLDNPENIEFLFIRGLEFKKRGVSTILKKIFFNIMIACCNPDNLYNLMELVVNSIDIAYNTKWVIEDFVQTDVYRPDKKNVKVQTFAARMREKNILIKPNERFRYVVVVKYPYSYSLRGCKEEFSVGDKIELLDEAIKNNYKIDMDYYMLNSIAGQLGRFITYQDIFYT